MFDFCISVTSKSEPCTKEAFERLIHDGFVKNRCDQIVELQNQLSPDASKSEIEAVEKKIKELKSGVKETKFPSLPGFCFHASYKDHCRQNISAVPSGLVSIDLDHIENPQEFFESLKETALNKRLALAFITPSTHGLKLVFPIPEGATDIETAQELIVKLIGAEAYNDGSTYDFARLAFVTPADYILYRNDDILFGENPLPESWGKGAVSNTNEKALSEEHTPHENAKEHFIDSINMADILTRLCENLTGKPEPDAGQRNNTLYQTAKMMRVYCDDDIDLLFEVMPRWGLEDSEWQSTIRSACKRPIAQSTRQEAEALLVQMRRERAIERGEVAWQLPLPPKNLPPVFKEFASVTPEELLPAQLLSLCSILGFYGTMSKANYNGPDEDEDWRAPNFITVIVAPPASGKDNITKTYKKLTENLRLKEAPLLAQMNKYNKTKKEEDMPKEGIRLLPERLSLTSLSLQLEMAKGKHVFIFTPEIDTLKTSNGSGGWADLSTVFRKAIDNDTIGQVYMSGDSHCTNVPAYLNMLILAQPETMLEFFNRKNIINGLVSRCLFVELPDNRGCRKVKVKKMSDFEWKRVQTVIDRLDKIGVVKEEAEYDADGNMLKAAVMERQVLNLPRTRKALKTWGLEHQNHYLQTQENPAEDNFFRRSSLLGFHAGMVAYMCAGCKETKAVIDFALWVAEFCLQSQLLHFGATYNEIEKRRTDSHIDRIMKINEVSQFNLLDALPDEFTTQDMKNVLEANGKSATYTPVKIKRWKEAGLIKEMPHKGTTKIWKKL